MNDNSKNYFNVLALLFFLCLLGALIFYFFYYSVQSAPLEGVEIYYTHGEPPRINTP
ncbi:MAG: hypothetical protein K0S38_886 [Candidatus Paceibacter sp.]|jgi:hypothetical protein|nr:hypothetical protein [Candidatus Paceibacter sp.]